MAASFDDDTVTVIDTEKLEPIATWSVPTGLGLTVHPTEPIAFSMESFDDNVHVLNYHHFERAGFESHREPWVETRTR